jgi:spermidine synthase
VPWVDTIRVVELAPEMVEAHRQLPELTGGVLAHPKLQLRIDDGRNFMSMTDEMFDVITADPIHPRITGVGYLYTREYYEQLRRRLGPGGMVVQWMPMYHISRHSFDVALRTFTTVFAHTSFWYVRGHGLMVGGDTPLTIDYTSLVHRFDDPGVRQDFAGIEIDAPEDLLATLLMDDEHARRYLATGAGTVINTDDNAFLEYRTPFEYLDRTEAIVAALVPHAGWDVDRVLPHAPEAFRQHVKHAAAARRSRLEPELREPLR